MRCNTCGVDSKYRDMRYGMCSKCAFDEDVQKLINAVLEASDEEVTRLKDRIHALKEKLDLLHDAMSGMKAVHASQAVNYIDRALKEIDDLLGSNNKG